MIDLSNPSTLVLIALGAISVFAVLAFVLFKTKQAPSFDPSEKVATLTTLISLENIQNVSFVRNKINLTVKDVDALDLEAIKATGITAFNVVGPTLKFHYASHTTTEAVYEALKQTVER